MKYNDELIKITCKLEEIQSDLEEIKELHDRIDSLESFRSYVYGIIGFIAFFIPIVSTILYKFI